MAHYRDDGGHDADREDTTPEINGEESKAAHMEDGTTHDEGTAAGGKKKRKKKATGGAGAV